MFAQAAQHRARGPQPEDLDEGAEHRSRVQLLHEQLSGDGVRDAAERAQLRLQRPPHAVTPDLRHDQAIFPGERGARGGPRARRWSGRLQHGRHHVAQPEPQQPRGRPGRAPSSRRRRSPRWAAGSAPATTSARWSSSCSTWRRCSTPTRTATRASGRRTRRGLLHRRRTPASLEDFRQVVKKGEASSSPAVWAPASHHAAVGVRLHHRQLG